MSYANLRLAAIILTVLMATIGLIQAADPIALGFTPVAARWLGIAAGVAGVVLGFLPRVQEASRRSTDQPPPAESDHPPPTS